MMLMRQSKDISNLMSKSNFKRKTKQKVPTYIFQTKQKISKLTDSGMFKYKPDDFRIRILNIAEV